MDRDHPRRVDPGRVAVSRAEDLVLADVEAVAAQLAAQQQPRPRLELVGEPAAVEPGRGRRARLVADVGLEDPQPAAAGRPLLRGRQDLHLDGRLLPQPQVADPHRRGGVAVGVGDVAQQVAEVSRSRARRRPRPASGRRPSGGSGRRRGPPGRASGRARRAAPARVSCAPLPSRTRSRRPGLGHGVIQGRFHARKARRQDPMHQPSAHDAEPKESVWDYPRPPRVEPEAAARPRRARRRDHRGLDPRRSGCSRRPARPRIYIPREDVREELLADARATTPTASGRAAPATCTPRPAAPAPSTRRGSTPSRGPTTPSSRATSPSTRAASTPPTSTTSRSARRAGAFYGGWVTDEIEGPYKGEPGTEGW